jgi:solute carrier family 25 (mitochondrial 2-oxodicarboxylate transporter), member 21
MPTMAGGTQANRFQVYYNGVFDCARKMIRSEGVFSLYKGIWPPILVETPKRAVKFLTFEQLKPLFLFGHDKPTPLVGFAEPRRRHSKCHSS